MRRRAHSLSKCRQELCAETVTPGGTEWARLVCMCPNPGLCGGSHSVTWRIHAVLIETLITRNPKCQLCWLQMYILMRYHVRGETWVSLGAHYFFFSRTWYKSCPSKNHPQSASLELKSLFSKCFFFFLMIHNVRVLQVWLVQSVLFFPHSPPPPFLAPVLSLLELFFNAQAAGVNRASVFLQTVFIWWTYCV